MRISFSLSDYWMLCDHLSQAPTSMNYALNLKVKISHSLFKLCVSKTVKGKETNTEKSYFIMRWAGPSSQEKCRIIKTLMVGRKNWFQNRCLKHTGPHPKSCYQFSLCPYLAFMGRKLSRHLGYPQVPQNTDRA